MSVASLDLLTFIALSCGVHADAVQSQVDDTRRAIMQMSSDEDSLSEMESRLRGLLKKQAKLHRLNNAIAHSRDQRRGDDDHRSKRGTSTRQSSQPTRTPSSDSRRSATARRGIRGLARSDDPAAAAPTSPSRASSIHLDSMSAAEVVRLSSRAVAAEDIPNAHDSRHAADPSTAADIETVDAETDAVKESLRQLESHSLKSKLLRLEAHKKVTATVDARQILSQYVTGFRFSDDVEALWGPTSGGTAPKDIAADGGRSPPSARTASTTGGLPRRTSLSASATSTLVVDGQAPVVNADTLPGIVQRACERLVGRYADAVDALGSTNLTEESAAESVLDCLLYACALDPERDDALLVLNDDGGTSDGPVEALTTALDVSALTELDALVRTAGAANGTPTRSSTSHALVDAGIQYDRVRFARATGQTKCGSAGGATSSVLSAQEFCALPVDWPSTQALVSVPVTALLAPARHLLTSRFSFADAAEMKRLDTLRLALQREVVRTAVDLEAVCEDIAGVAPQQLRPRDVTVMRGRLAAAANTSADADRVPCCWSTLIKEGA